MLLLFIVTTPPPSLELYQRLSPDLQNTGTAFYPSIDIFLVIFSLRTRHPSFLFLALNQTTFDSIPLSIIIFFSELFQQFLYHAQVVLLL